MIEKPSFKELEQMVNNDIPLLICRFLPTGKITFVNNLYCEYFGKTLEDLVGSNFLSLIPENERKAVMANIQSLTVESPTQTNIHQVISEKGVPLWQQWTNKALFDNQGRVVAYQSIGEDITGRKLVETERERLINELEFALSEIKVLRGILPVCCVCGLIRDDTGAGHGKGEWIKVDKFVVEKTNAQVSHSYCPKCYEKAMEEDI